MRVNKRAIFVVISLLLIALVASSCSSYKFSRNENSGSQDSAPYEPEFGYDGAIDTDEKATQEDLKFTGDRVEPEKVITNVNLSLETTEFDSTIEKLSDIVNANKGYIEGSHISRRHRSNNKVFKYAEYTVRVPKDNVDDFTGKMESIGSIVSQNTSKEDITKHYYDTESRLNLLKVKEERMTALLKKAERMEDIITIENQLSEIIHQKENLTKSIVDMDDKVSYSVVHINISEVEKLRNDITTDTTFGTKISNAFDDSLYMFRAAIEGFVLVFIYLLPYLLIGGLIAFLVFKFIIKRRQQ